MNSNNNFQPEKLIENRHETEEYKRLIESQNQKQSWKRWGPYLSDRQWGTVREDYSAGGAAWDDFSHDQARSRAYRWGEDGIMGMSDDHQRLCFALSLWNGKDPILKERLYGLTGSGSNNPGNHGEDVKEYYFYLDNTPTHSYMKGLYKYPHAEYPYRELNEKSRELSQDKKQPEFELLDTQIFEEKRYFDVLVEYAKVTPEDMLVQFTITNRGPEAKTLHLAPTLWFRNTWSWYAEDDPKKIYKQDPVLKEVSSALDVTLVEASFNDEGLAEELTDQKLGKRWLYCEKPNEMLFTNNDSNRKKLGWSDTNPPDSFFKDAVNQYIVEGDKEAVNLSKEGTKVAAYYELTDIPAGATRVVRLRLSDKNDLTSPFGAEFDAQLSLRKQEADTFYKAINPFPISQDMLNVQRQAFAGMLWGKQFYYYIVQDWLNGDSVGPAPPEERKKGRNHEWTHLFNEDILSMPDKWEYPWFAAWDLAFHTVTFSLIDPEFAKRQLRLLVLEWYMHPNGQMPAYEWEFGDVNPPVHAWAAWRVYKIEKKMFGTSDRRFLEEIFQKLSLYFTWWTNRKDPEGKDIFGGGFLGLDNIGPIDRSHLTDKESLYQADGTAWMAMYCLNMLEIALELAAYDSAYNIMASKFFQHFLLIADSMNKLGNDCGINIWNEDTKFYRDVLRTKVDDHNSIITPIDVRSMVGLIPLYAVTSIDGSAINEIGEFKERFSWFIQNQKELTEHDNVAMYHQKNGSQVSSLFLALVSPGDTNSEQQIDQPQQPKKIEGRLRDILSRLLNPDEFLGDYGIRALSKVYEKNPYVVNVPYRGEERVTYKPAESDLDLFGGNSNWRGPIWFPVNFLLIESLQKFYYFLGDEATIEYQSKNGEISQKNLWEISADISHRLISVFLKDEENRRPVYGSDKTMFGATNLLQVDPDWQNHLLFFEYFHGDNGAGVGASHQTGWTGVVAKLIQQHGEYVAHGKKPIPQSSKQVSNT